MAFQSRAVSSIFIVIFTLFFLPTAVLSSSVTLEWDPNTETDLAGYKVFYGISSGEYSTIFDAGLTTDYTVVGLSQGVYILLRAEGV